MNKDHKQWLILVVLFGSFVWYEGHTFGFDNGSLACQSGVISEFVRQSGTSAAVKTFFDSLIAQRNITENIHVMKNKSLKVLR